MGMEGGLGQCQLWGQVSRSRGETTGVLLLRAPCAAQWAKVGDIGVSELIGEREKERSKINVLGMPLFIYLFILFLFGFLGFFLICLGIFACRRERER